MKINKLFAGGAIVTAVVVGAVLVIALPNSGTSSSAKGNLVLVRNLQPRSGTERLHFCSRAIVRTAIHDQSGR
jgi:hypothetical protein